MSAASSVEARPEATTPPSLAPVTSISRRDAVCAEIRRAIIVGGLKPGDKLTELSLASSLQVSRATVREALGQLAQEGLVVSEPYRGLRVADLDLRSVRDLAKTRVALDMLALRDVVADPTGQGLALVRAAWTRYAAAVHDPDPYVRHQEHVAFHRAIWLAAGNTVINQLWPVVEANMTIAMARDEAVRPSTERAYRLHAQLVEAIETKDLTIIEETVINHTLTSADEFIALQAGELA